MTTSTKVAIIGSGNIGTDLMFKVMRLSKHLQMAAMVGIDPASDAWPGRGASMCRSRRRALTASSHWPTSTR